MRIHIGKRVPKGFVELPGAMHLGKGIWMFRIEKEPPSSALGQTPTVAQQSKQDV